VTGSDEWDKLVERDERAEAASLSVVRGEPTVEELAALVAVIASRSSDDARPSARSKPKVSGWTDRRRYVRGGLMPSPDGWRTSVLPR
jgi:Acyl-CoA carboxylase epsilon subunit